MYWNDKGLEAALAAGAPVPEVEMNSRLNLAENLLSLGRLDVAAEQLHMVEAVVRHPRPRQDVMRWRYGQRFLHRFGEYWLTRGDPARALELAEGVGSPPQIWKTRLALGDLREVQGRPEEARRAYQEAVAVVDEMASRLTDRELRETFLASEQVQPTRRRAACAGPGDRLRKPAQVPDIGVRIPMGMLRWQVGSEEYGSFEPTVIPHRRSPKSTMVAPTGSIGCLRSPPKAPSCVRERS
jgi:tetratricopeptide (TPR) repeat protein